MPGRPGRVVYIDFSETATHADTLWSAVRFLEPYEVRWVFDPSYRDHLPPALNPADVAWLPSGRGQLGALRGAWEAAREVSRFRPEAVHVNGAQGRRTRAFSVLTARSRAVFSGTHHNAAKLAGGGSQRVINRRIRRFAVLADFIREHLATRVPSDIKLVTVRPIFFPRVEAALPGRRLRVAVVGSLHADRRDYEGLARMLDADPPLEPSIEIVVLGDASTPGGRAIRSAIGGTRGAGCVSFVDRFLSFPELFQEVARSHVLLPLVHPDTPRFEEYRTGKITGSMLLAFGFRKPMILHRSLAGLVDFRGIAVPYEVPELSAVLNRLANDPAELAGLVAAFDARDDLGFETQAGRFRELLGIPAVIELPPLP